MRRLRLFEFRGVDALGRIVFSPQVEAQVLEVDVLDDARGVFRGHAFAHGGGSGDERGHGG